MQGAGLSGCLCCIHLLTLAASWLQPSWIIKVGQVTSWIVPPLPHAVIKMLRQMSVYQWGLGQLLHMLGCTWCPCRGGWSSGACWLGQCRLSHMQVLSLAVQFLLSVCKDNCREIIAMTDPYLVLKVQPYIDKAVAVLCQHWARHMGSAQHPQPAEPSAMSNAATTPDSCLSAFDSIHVNCLANEVRIDNKGAWSEEQPFQETFPMSIHQ